MRVVGVPYWRLRDYRRAATRRQQREQSHQAVRHVVHQAALEQPTYGYRRLYHMLKARGQGIGRERVRRLLAMLGLTHVRLRKKRRAPPAVTAMAALPPGRRVQIDATRLTLGGGVTWVYMVEDVASRACLAVSVGRRLSHKRAAQALQEGHRALQQGGITAALVVQSDGGSEFRASCPARAKFYAKTCDLSSTAANGRSKWYVPFGMTCA
jgi:putative transposase